MPAKKGNKYAEKWTEENAIAAFEEAEVFAANDAECLCIEDAIHFAEIPYSTFYYLLGQFEVLDSIKKSIDAHIRRRINKGGLTGKFQPAMSIWRLKQLGEKDKSENTNLNYNIERELTEAEMKKLEKRLKSDY